MNFWSERRAAAGHGDEAARPVPPPPGPPPELYREPQPPQFYDWQYEEGLAPQAAAPQAAPREEDEGRCADPWRPLVVGTPVPRFDPRPPGGLSYRPDTVCDGWSTAELDLRLASVRGYQHRYDGRPREDDAAAAWDPDSGTVLFAVADGVSDARQPHIGSQLACRAAVDEMSAQVRASQGRVTEWRKVLQMIHWQLRAQAGRILGLPQEAEVAETADLLATTLVAGVATPTAEGVAVGLLWVGDSGIWQIKHDRLYPMKGGKQAGADGLVSSAVQPLPYVPAEPGRFDFVLEPGTVLLVGTDGFGDPVGDGRGDVGRLFADQLRKPVPPLGFAHLLDFSRETFDDDRTLLALWPRSPGTGGRR
ncbi:protein phosphatase 2C domain-containing protein [Streptomyces sp. NPDC053367]|uniref:protein phosphatase 2C domain-containing protein n=1 Tax=Streptomyces sp. NPDC053367 TaxID=3365700 RepID=UPI0037D4282E